MNTFISKPRAVSALLILLLVILGGLFAYLPSAGLPIYASPDETATAVTAKQLRETGSARIPETEASRYPWLHPRSFVSHGSAIVPVGFIGWPWFASIVIRLLGEGIMPWLGGIVLLSAAYPVFRLLEEEYGDVPAFFGTLVAFTAPAMILYANRGLFPNGAVFAFGMWGMWMMRMLNVECRMPNVRRGIFSFFAGVACALAIAIRPIEIVWLLPWWIWFARGWRPNRRELAALAAGALLILMPITVVAERTYGDWFTFGYFLRDNAATSSISMRASSNAGIQPDSRFKILDSLFPFGFHPRSIWWNVRHFLIGLQWPWVILVLGAAVVACRKRVTAHRMPIPLIAWTVCALLLVYGNGLYADHVRFGAVTIGNSFLRYLLPLAAFAGWSAAFLLAETASRRVWRAFGITVCLGVSAFGGYLAYAGDDEGLITTRGELMRYAEIRRAAQNWFAGRDVIFSERSDKIFFPDSRAVAPLPPKEEIRRWIEGARGRAGLFARPMSQAQKDEWAAAGLDALELASFGREKLYQLILRSRAS